MASAGIWTQKYQSADSSESQKIEGGIKT